MVIVLKKIFLTLLVTVNLSCTTIYYVEVGARHESSKYTEYLSSGKTVSKSDGFGGSFGYIAADKWLHYRNTFFASKQGEQEVESNGTKQTIKNSDQQFYGLETALGLNLPYIKPYLSSSAVLGNVSEFFPGYGVRLEVPISQTMMLSFDYNYRDYDSSGTFPERDEAHTASIGLMFGAWKIGYLGRGHQFNTKKPRNKKR